MKNMRLRVNTLLPNALCFIREDVIVEWTDPRPQPSESELEAVDVQAILLAIESEKQETETEIKDSPITGITYAQAESWIDNTVVDLDTAKLALKKLARIVLAIAKKQGLSE